MFYNLLNADSVVVAHIFTDEPIFELVEGVDESDTKIFKVLAKGGKILTVAYLGDEIPVSFTEVINNGN